VPYVKLTHLVTADAVAVASQDVSYSGPVPYQRSLVPNKNAPLRDRDTLVEETLIEQSMNLIEQVEYTA